MNSLSNYTLSYSTGKGGEYGFLLLHPSRDGPNLVLKGGDVVKDNGTSAPLYFGKKLVKVDVPSLVFVNLPDDGVDCYRDVKFLSHFAYGVNSQCFTAKKKSASRDTRQDNS